MCRTTRTWSCCAPLQGTRAGRRALRRLIASPEIVIALLRKVIPPYALTQLTIEAVLRQLEPARSSSMRARASLHRACERALAQRGTARGCAESCTVWPSEANFLLVEFEDAAAAFGSARATRACWCAMCARQPGLERALRITIGTPEQNRTARCEAWR